MKPFLAPLLFLVLLISCFSARGNAPYFIAGKVVDEKGAVVAGATVFISGSQRVTITNNDGRFIFNSIDAGTYHLSVQMLGYNSYTKNVMIQTESVNLDITLTVKPILLNTVKIGGDGNWAKNYEIFKRHFFGITSNAQHCKILNPEVISFGTQGKLLTAEADELIIVENKLLGYRIRYLLKSFTCNPTMRTASYDGDPIFEPLDGTDADKANWATNRINAYHGSLMHFLRAVYNNTVLEEGFIANQLYVQKNSFGSFHADPRPVRFDTIVNVIDTSFIAAKFSSLYVSYDKKKAAEIAKMPADTVKKRLTISPTGSILNLYLKEAVIDRKGNYVDYRTFLLQGLWGRRGIADQLPFEYQPAITAK